MMIIMVHGTYHAHGLLVGPSLAPTSAAFTPMLDTLDMDIYHVGSTPCPLLHHTHS